MKISNKELLKLRTKKGGWSREVLESLGVPWPPPKGWKKKLIKGKAVKPKNKIRPKKPKSFYSTEEWGKIRYKALKLSKGKCELCGRSGKESILHVDHIKPRHKHPELQLVLTNLQVLCAVCNYGKSGWDETDWRDEETTNAFLEAMARDTS